MGLSSNQFLNTKLTNPNPVVASAQQQLGVSGVGKSEGPLKKPESLTETDQNKILKTISDGYTLQMKEGKVENVGTFFTILETLSQDSILSKDTSQYITQITNNFKAVKTELQGKSPIDESTIAAVVPSMLDGIHQLFEFVSLLDDAGKNKPSFQKIAGLALECKTKFQADPAKSRMINHVKNKLDYFLQKDDNSALSNTDPLLSITIFADVDSNLQTLFKPPTAISKPTPPTIVGSSSPTPKPTITKPGWKFSTFAPVTRLGNSLSDLATPGTTPTSVTKGNYLKGDNRITDEALEQIKHFTQENMSALERDDQEVLLQNLKNLKDEFDPSELNLEEGEDVDQNINELDETDIRKVVQGKIEFLKDLMSKPSE